MGKESLRFLGLQRDWGISSNCLSDKTGAKFLDGSYLHESECLYKKNVTELIFLFSFCKTSWLSVQPTKYIMIKWLYLAFFISDKFLCLHQRLWTDRENSNKRKAHWVFSATCKLQVSVCFWYIICLNVECVFVNK